MEPRVEPAKPEDDRDDSGDDPPIRSHWKRNTAFITIPRVGVAGLVFHSRQLRPLDAVITLAADHPWLFDKLLDAMASQPWLWDIFLDTMAFDPGALTTPGRDGCPSRGCGTKFLATMGAHTGMFDKLLGTMAAHPALWDGFLATMDAHPEMFD